MSYLRFVRPMRTLPVFGKQPLLWLFVNEQLSQVSKRVVSSSRSETPAETVTAKRAEHDQVRSPSRNNLKLPESATPRESDSTRPFICDARKVDPTTVKQVFYFDTLELTKTLETRGFSRSQAEGLSQSLVDIINSTLDHQTRHMVTKPQQEVTVQKLMSEISAVKKDMVILQRSEFSSLRTETEKQTFEIAQVKDQLSDEVSQLKDKIKLEINIEKTRAVEAHAENETQLQELHNKIDTEIANLQTVYEKYRNDVFRYAGGTVLTCAGLCLGIIRMWSH